MYPQVFGKYVLERELSRGGMARVLLATLRGAGGFEKRLVVKQIRDELSFDQQFVRRFVEEAKTTVALSHPNIVPVYELGVEQGTYFLAMELVEGCSIAEIVRERHEDGTRRVLSPEEGAYVGMEVCRALDYAHRRMKVVHRDITPRNVMLDEEGQVKLIDFGIAAPARVAGHEILGSPGHMPPEQVDGKELGPPTDIFALAVLLMEAWSGVATFRRATPEACDDAMRMPHPRPSDYDPRLIPLDDVIVRAMKLDPRERQQNATDLGRALRAFLQGIDVTDIARELGDRVRDQRQAASEPAPSSVHAARAPAASVGELGTQTFAARDEAIRWSRPPSSEIEPPGASTRRLADSNPPSAEVLGETPVSPAIPPAPPASPGPEAMEMATPVEPAAPPPQPPKDERARVDTLATRPIETPVRVRNAARPDRGTQRSRTGLIVGVTAALAVLAAGAGAAWRARTTEGRSEPQPVVPTASGVTAHVSGAAGEPSLPVASAPRAPAPAAIPSGSLPVNGPGREAITPTRPHGTASVSPPVMEKAGKALVSFLGDPGTRVSIDGASRGPCPVRVSLEPGSHDVRFQFDPTGESRGERFSVKANERVTVRAEFTGATPTVRFQR